MKKSIAVKIFTVALGLFVTVLILHFLIFNAFFNQVYVGSMARSYQNELREAVADYSRGSAETSSPVLRRFAAETGSPVLVFTDRYQLGDGSFMEQMSTVTLRLEDGREMKLPIKYLFSLMEYPRLTISNRVRVSAVPLGDTGYWEPLVIVHGDRSWTNGPSVLTYGGAGASPPVRYPAVVTQTQYFTADHDSQSTAAALVYEQVKDCLINRLEIDEYLAQASNRELTDVFGGVYRLFYHKMILGDTGYYFVTARRIPFSGQEQSYINSLFAIIYGILAALLIGSAYILSRYISRPLARLSLVTEKLAQLDFSQQADMVGEDELGRMSRSVNTLSGNLEMALSRARDNEERMKRLLADLAHEFKTPLGIIAFYTELFEKGAYTDRPQEYYTIVDKQIDMLTGMVNEAIELSTLQSGNWSVDIGVCDLSDIVNSVLELFQKRLASEGYTVETADFALLVRADARRIEQVLCNFMSNAYKYCDERKIIRLGWSETGEGSISAYVANSGSLSESERDRIWARYYSKPGNIKARLPSEGIGLDIVKSILDSHGSRYGVRQREGMVYFHFSLERAEEAEREG